jgi:oxygen-independent coproporphyrinogen-3 oxidase
MKLAQSDLALIAKYDQPGPRYTSYPTALHFSGEADQSALLKGTVEDDGPLSLYFHIPYCESLCWFCGCHTIITKAHGRADGYLDLLEKEVALFRSRLRPDREVVQVHFGGGTPNFLDPGQIARLGRLINDNFTFGDDVEFGVEMDPRRLTREHLASFREIGANRTSFGVQDCNPEVQKAIHRVQPGENNRDAIKWLRELGFGSFNIDLIYGLPLQTVKSFGETLDEVIGYHPDRFAVFNYAHVPNLKPAQKILERATLPTPELKLQLLQLIIEKLTSAGYIYIGMDHYARADDELAVAQGNRTLQRNFQGYSTKAGVEICGFGVSSISQTAGAYRQNLKAEEAYRASLEAGELPVDRGYVLTDDDRIRRETIMRMMCDLGLDYGDMSTRLGIDFEAYFSEALSGLDGMVDDGLIERVSGGLSITDLGRLFIRNVAMHFDAYIGVHRNRYSRTV